MTTMKRVLEYFSLFPPHFDEEPEPSLGRPRKAHSRVSTPFARAAWTASLYGAVFFGVMSEHVLDSSAKPGFRVLIAAAVVAALLYPHVHRQLGARQRLPQGVDLFIAFQGGFFWRRALETLSHLWASH